MAGAPAPELVGSPPMVSALCGAGGRKMLGVDGGRWMNDLRPTKV